MAKKKDAMEVFHIIRVNPPQNKDESMKVCPCVNGKNFEIKRGELVPVPQIVVNVLNSAEVPVYQDKTGEELLHSGETRKVVGYTHRFPFSIMYRNISKEAYEELRRIAMQPGAKLTEEKIEEILDQVANPKKAVNE